jgi:small subunit ribosomal protein S20
LANIASQIKRNRQNEKRRLRNRDARGAARSAVKGVLTNMNAEQPSAEGIDLAIRLLDRAARRGAIHRRNAARRKSRLVKRMTALGLKAPAVSQAPTPEEPAASPKKSIQRASKKAVSKK